MADYSPGPPLSPSALANLRAKETIRVYERAARVTEYCRQIGKILDSGTVVTPSELVALVKALNEPVEDEIWEAIRSISLDKDPNYSEISYGRLGRPKSWEWHGHRST